VWIKIVSLLARLGLVAVFAWAAIPKIADPIQSEVAVRAYQLFPESLVGLVAMGLPALELAFAIILLLGIGNRVMGAVTIAFMAVMISGIISAWARGLSIDCGCFGGGGAVEGVTWRDYASEIARDIGFALLGLWLCVFPRTPLALGPGSRANTALPGVDADSTTSAT
jgi:uncharacterized membrane protein YphA (DoxX/SURF4 family)